MRVEPMIRWWKLNGEEYSEKWREEVSQVLCEEEDRWALISVVSEKAKKALGVTLRWRTVGWKTWWWDEEVHASKNREKQAKKK